MPGNMLNGAQVIVDYLIQEKVPQVFGLCGHGNIQFIDALYERSSEIKTISVHHESVAGFMADVYYRVSGRPTATFTSCGPGSANLPISLANAFLDSVPFMAVTGNVPTSQFNRGAFQEMYRHYQADFPSTVRTICKKVFQPTRGEMVPLAVRQAWKTMVTGRPGPVVLDVPFDVFLEGAAVELAGRDIAGDRHERHRIEEGVAERNGQVGRPRSARSESRGGAAGYAVIHVGHETSDGFVVHRDSLEVVLALVQRVDELNVAMAAKAEDVGHLLPNQIVDNDLCSVELVGGHCSESPFVEG